MANETEPPAIVQNAESAAAFIAEAKAIDETILVDLGRAAASTKLRGELLLKAKKAVGHGNWMAFVSKHWPGVSYSTIARYMRLSKLPTLAHLKKVTHRQIESDEAPDRPPLMAAEREVLIRLIEIKKPGLAKKLRDGTKTLSDAKLLKEVPTHCEKCGRDGPPPKPCEQCKLVQEDHQASLREPQNEDDATSPPKPPEDPFKQAKALTTKLTTLFTKLTAENGDLYRAFVACGLMDHPKDKTPRFLALAGVARVLSEVSRGETDLEKIKLAFREACGTFIPEKRRYWMEQNMKRRKR